MKEADITDKQILDEAKDILSNPQMRRCNQCANSNDDCSWCNHLKKPLTRFMYAGLCKFYETHDERIIRETRQALKLQEEKEIKLNHLLTLCLNCLDASMMFLEDFADRVEEEYIIADRRGVGDAKIRRNDRNWIGQLKKANKEMHRCIEGARRQYNCFVMPILNRVFYDKTDKIYDVQKYDDHQSDVAELAHLVMRYFDVAYLSKKNADQVFGLLKSMDSCGVMEESDFNHYNFRR